jgi:hypothetical protein
VTPDQKARNVAAFESLVKVAALGESKEKIAPLTEWYSLAPIEPAGALWYFGYKCPSCGRDSPLFRDFSDGNLGTPFVGYGVRSICLFCRAEMQCASEGIRPMQWPLEPGQKRPVTEYAIRVTRKYKDDPEYKPVAGPLHHYTSLDGLLCIAKDKVLRATSVHYLNDSSESELGLSLMRTVAKEAKSTATGIDGEFLDYFLSSLNEKLWKSESVYVLCFSEQRDQLSQWRGYTPHGRGVCISIDSGLLVRLMQAYGWNFQNCRYTRTSQLSWAEAILSRLRREAAQAATAGDESHETYFEGAMRKNLSDLLGVAATIKNESFKDEHEVRFISPLISLSDSRVSYRVGRTTLIPYIEFKLADADDSVSFAEVWVGPSPTQRLTKLAIEGLVESGKIKAPCQVEESSIPYREL